MKRGKSAELFPGETYALGFRRLSEEVWRFRYLRAQARAGMRLRRKAKSMETVINALQNYCDARERGEVGASSSRHRETLWARLQYELRTYNHRERQAVTMAEVHHRKKKISEGSGQ